MHQEIKTTAKTRMKHHPVAFGYLTNKQIICLFSFPPDTANKCRIKISKWSDGQQAMEEQARECGFVKKGLAGNDMNYLLTVKRNLLFYLKISRQKIELFTRNANAVCSISVFFFN